MSGPAGRDAAASGGGRGPEIMADHGLDRAMAKGDHHAHGIAQQVQETKGGEVAVVARVPAGGTAVATLVGSEGVVARRRQRRQHLAPAIGDLGKAMQQEHSRPTGRLVTGLEDVHV
jgi:hypothetical protein